MIEFFRKRIPVLLLLLTALAEVFIWNYASLASLFYQEIDLTAQTSTGWAAEEGQGFVLPEGKLVIHIPEVNQKIHNLHMEAVPVPALSAGGANTLSYVIALSDEGNFLPYELPAGKVVAGVRATEYIRIHSYGRVKELEIAFTGPEGLAVREIRVRANVKQPFIFSALRMVICYLLLFVAWSLLSGKAWLLPCAEREPGQLFMTAAVLAVIMAASLNIAAANPINVRPIWPHHRQYHELAEALLTGQAVLPVKPPEELLRIQNPYDTVWLQHEQIDYKADYAYYEGNYYVYFGIVPELLLYLPLYVIMGFHLPNYLAVLIFFDGFAVMVFALYRELIRRYFSRTPFWIYLLISVMTVFAGSFTWLVANPDLYAVPIAGALMFAAAGLWLWMKALRPDTGGLKRSLLLMAGSLCLALIAGCRPQMVLYGGLGLPLFYHSIFKDRTLFSRSSIKPTLALCLPVAAVAAGLMYYNGIRFGSPFDFGAAYSLTSNDMTRREISLEQTGLGLFHYLLQPPTIQTVFPFVFRNEIANDYMGKLTSEYTYGGLFACNTFVWLAGLFGMSRVRNRLREAGLFAFVLTAVGISVVIAAVDINYAGILQRYLTDFTFGFMLAAGIIAFAWLDRMRRMQRTAAKVLVPVVLLQCGYSILLLFGGGAGAYGLEQEAPEIFYYFASWF